MTNDTDALPPFSIWLERQLVRRGWNGSDLARAMDVAPGTVWNWTHGKRRLRDSDLIRRMAEAFQINQDVILEQLDLRDGGADRMTLAVRALAPTIDAYDWSDEDLEHLRNQIESLAEWMKVRRFD